MVQHIECLRPELQVHGLGEVEVLVEGKVPGPEAGGAERVSSQVGSGSVAGDDVAIIRIRGRIPNGRIESQRSAVVHVATIGRSVQEGSAADIRAAACAFANREQIALQGLTQHIPCTERVDAYPVPGGISISIGIHESRLKSYRLSRLRENGSTEAEAIRQRLNKVVVGMSFRKVVGERQGEPVPHIEVRAGAVVSEVVRVLRTPRIQGTGIELVI